MMTPLIFYNMIIAIVNSFQAIRGRVCRLWLDYVLLLSLLLLVPLKPLSGVSDTAESIAQLAVVAQSATQVAKEMPQMIRWQTEMLLLELDDMDTTTTLRNELAQRVADEFGQVADAADELPTRRRCHGARGVPDREPEVQRATGGDAAGRQGGHRRAERRGA